MAKRFLFGLVKGVLVGAALSFLWMRAFGAAPFAGWLGYVAAVLTGAISGVVAGKPLWAKGALIEAALKGIVGAIVGFAALYGIRRWLPLTLELGPVGSGALGLVPTFALPIIATAIGVVFELDNTGAAPVDDKRARIAPPSRATENVDLDELEESHPTSLPLRRKN